MMRVAAFIVHAPWATERRSNVSLLTYRLQRAFGTGDSTVIEDTGRAGHWPTFRTGFLWAMSTGATHVVAVEDDVELSGGFGAAVRSIIGVRPEAVIALFSMRKTVRLAMSRDIRWCATRKLVNDQCTIYPVAWLAGWLKFMKQAPPSRTADAARILYMAHRKELAYYVAPTLADHIMPGTSLLGHANSRRVSPCFVGPSDASAIDWSRGADTPVMDAHNRSFEQQWSLMEERARKEV